MTGLGIGLMPSKEVCLHERRLINIFVYKNSPFHLTAMFHLMCLL